VRNKNFSVLYFIRNFKYKHARHSGKYSEILQMEIPRNKIIPGKIPTSAELRCRGHPSHRRLSVGLLMVKIAAVARGPPKRLKYVLLILLMEFPAMLGCTYQ
jgi:hypothetical protein